MGNSRMRGYHGEIHMVCKWCVGQVFEIILQ